MAQKQNEKASLLCVYKDCKTLQGEDGEYCDKHYKILEMVAVLKDAGFDTKDITELEAVERAFSILSQESLIDYDVYERGDTGSDYWLQAEYHSNKIGKTIIWDYDFQSDYSSLEELAELAYERGEEIKDFESKEFVIN